MEFILDAFCYSLNNRNKNVITITKYNEEIYLHAYDKLISSTRFIHLDYLNHRPIEYRKDSSFNILFPINKRTINTYVPIIYYSGIFDGKREKHFRVDREQTSVSSNFFLSENNARYLRSKDIYNQINLIQSDIDISQNISIPNRLNISCIVRSYLDFERLFNSENSFSDYFRKTLIEEIRKAHVNAKGFYRSLPFSKELIISLFYEWCSKNISRETEKYVELYFSKYKDNQYKNILDCFEDLIINHHIQYQDDTIIKLISVFEEGIANNYIQPQPTTSLSEKEYLVIEDIKQFDNLVQSLIENYVITMGNYDDYLEFQWRDMSTGEKLLLNLLGRFYAVPHFHREKKTIILIDEGELGLHPQWQKQYLKILLETIPKIFPNKEIQLILTSHSPFLVSDLPKENVIFLEKDHPTGECRVSKLESMKETFGANIHTLLTDSFFMKGGLVGEFAQSKIDEAIDILNESEPKKEDLEKCEMIISMMGEPIVKNMLQKLLDSKRLRKVDTNSDEIEKLRKRIEELENKNNNGTDLSV
ncbi:AAA family ATPase [Bernardetia sp.]|uniref:AAA family ATPase n=1 Tax=Bernardetia sp. TaxID=1937974 RepID=UPI0025C4E48F|nr:AAA family ATPase [Bernardetia sp.]